jgi:hypothetical protein
MERYIVFSVREYPEVCPVKHMVGLFVELEKAFLFIKTQPRFNDYEIHKLVLDEEGVVVSDKVIGYVPV